jgi:hypothetical protein
MLLLMSVQGCIVADPPVFEQPERTPPFLDLAAANPSIFEILRQGPSDLVLINVPVRSEDAGQRLQAVLFLNYQMPTEDPQNTNYLDPSTFSDRGREIKMSWTVPSVPKSTCQRLTLQVTHADNLDDQSELRDKSDVGLATWWVDIQVDDLPADFTQCPGIGAGT